jgi:hypothetical protein
MLVAVFLTARWINQRFDEGRGSRARFVTGFIALGFLFGAELVLGVGLRGVLPKEALINRDPVSGTAYYAALCIFAITPGLLGQFGRRAPRDRPRS